LQWTVLFFVFELDLSSFLACVKNHAGLKSNVALFEFSTAHWAFKWKSLLRVQHFYSAQETEVYLALRTVFEASSDRFAACIARSGQIEHNGQ
jgi:hypothetical protein